LVGERRALARDGTITAIIVLSAETGAIIAGPELVSRGLVSGDGTSAHMREARGELEQRLSMLRGRLRAGDPALHDEIVRTLKRYFGDALGKRPLVVPHVMEV
jgi:ribonuclease J